MNMTKEQAINVLIAVAKLAQASGRLSLDDAAATATAVRVLQTEPADNAPVPVQTPEPVPQEMVEEEQ